MTGSVSGAGGFRLLRKGGTRVLVRDEAVPWVEETLSSHGTLHAAAAEAPAALRFEGRRAVFAILAPHAAGGRWVVRHSSRGGAVASLMGDRYLRIGAPRPFAEAEASEALRARGFRTPRVIAAAVYSAGCFRRGDLVTEYIPGAVELAEILFGQNEGERDRVAALRAVGALARGLAEGGAYHPDLNAKNILLEGVGADEPGAHLIDLDRCRVSLPARSRSRAGARMHRRLHRSLRKWEGASGAPLSSEEWHALDEGFRAPGA